MTLDFIHSVKKVVPSNPNGQTILYLNGHGGRTYLSLRQLNVLKNEGFHVTALDFSFSIRKHNPRDLIRLIDQVDEFIRNNGLLNEKLTIIGISLGGLVGFNMIRRHKVLRRLVVITGGNIALVPSNRHLKKKWSIDRKKLHDLWSDVNMFTPIGKIRHKNILMLLPKNDKVINPEEVSEEIELLKPCNNIEVIRTPGGHYRTVISETIINPDRILSYLKTLDRSDS
jgi:alpha-beta hydrolase superfamily lysophospholipase